MGIERVDVTANGRRIQIKHPGQLKHSSALAGQVDDLKSAIPFDFLGRTHLGLKHSMGFAPFLQSVAHIVQLEKFKNLSHIYLVTE